MMSDHVVPADLAGERADKIVAVLADLSRSVARSLIDERLVTVEGGPVDPKQRLLEGVELTIEMPVLQRLEAEDIPLVVRYEDDHVAVVDKPAGVVVHPGAGRTTGTLAAGLLARWPDLEGVGQTDRWGIVHRLDREVSGLLVVALTGVAYEKLVAALKRRSVARDYRALVWGALAAATGTIDAPIGRDARFPARMATQVEGRPSRTHYRRAAHWSQAGLSLLEASLETGRTHQIRVHFSSIGHPVVGDRVYGRPGPAGVDPHRVWLHAAHLGFEHPVTGEALSVDSPLPEDLQASLDMLGPPD
jgi:23S rRNA pseudouridine1911/1915/1917 synthase